MSFLLDRESPKSAAADRWEQSLLRVAALPAGITAGLSVVAVLATLLSAGSKLSGAFGAIGSVWLAVHQVPVYIGGTDLGALPLLPTLLVFAGVTRVAYRYAAADASPIRQLQILGAAVAGPLVVTLAALALIADVSASLGVSGPGPLASMGGVAVVHGGAAILGVGLRVLWANAERWEVPTWMLTSLRAGAIAALSVFSAGALLVVVGTFFSWTEIAEIFGAENSVIGQLGLLLLSIMYLPNVMVAGAAVLSGSTAQIGEASYSLFEVHPGPLPEVPVLGVLPLGGLGGLWPLLLVVCAGIGLWIGWRYRSVADTALDTVRFFVSAGAVAAMIAMALGFLAGGEMGSFGYLGSEPPIFAMYVFGWVTVAGLLVAFASMALRRRGALVEAEYDDEDYAADADVDDEYIDEYVVGELTVDTHADEAVDDHVDDELREADSEP